MTLSLASGCDCDVIDHPEPDYFVSPDVYVPPVRASASDPDSALAGIPDKGLPVTLAVKGASLPDGIVACDFTTSHDGWLVPSSAPLMLYPGTYSFAAMTPLMVMSGDMGVAVSHRMDFASKTVADEPVDQDRHTIKFNSLKRHCSRTLFVVAFDDCVGDSASARVESMSLSRMTAQPVRFHPFVEDTLDLSGSQLTDRLTLSRSAFRLFDMDKSLIMPGKPVVTSGTAVAATELSLPRIAEGFGIDFTMTVDSMASPLRFTAPVKEGFPFKEGYTYSFVLYITPSPRLKIVMDVREWDTREFPDQLMGDGVLLFLAVGEWDITELESSVIGGSVPLSLTVIPWNDVPNPGDGGNPLGAFRILDLSVIGWQVINLPGELSLGQ